MRGYQSNAWGGSAAVSAASRQDAGAPTQPSVLIPFDFDARPFLQEG